MSYVAMGIDVDEDMQAVLLRLTGDLTPSNLRLLRILAGPYQGLPGGPRR